MATCRACGAQAPDDASFCPTCGNTLAPRAGPAAQAPGSGREATTPDFPRAPAPPPAPMGPPARARPLGVTILAVLDVVGGVLLALVGIVLAVSGPLLADDPAFRDAFNVPGMTPEGFAGIAVGFGVVMVVVAAVLVLVGWGLYQGRGWAWTVSVGLIVLSLAWDVVLLAFGDLTGVVGLAINGFLLWYFLQAGVKRWFGKGEPEGHLPTYVPPPS